MICRASVSSTRVNVNCIEILYNRSFAIFRSIYHNELSVWNSRERASHSSKSFFFQLWVMDGIVQYCSHAPYSRLDSILPENFMYINNLGWQRTEHASRFSRLIYPGF